jgi:hypothetical protein
MNRLPQSPMNRLPQSPMIGSYKGLGIESLHEPYVGRA